MNKDLYAALKEVSGDENEKSTPCELRVNGSITSDPTSIMETFATQQRNLQESSIPVCHKTSIRYLIDIRGWML